MSVLDSIDRRILRTLERDGRIRNVDLADLVGLSPSACLRRVHDLEKSGVITRYRAVLNRDEVERGFVAYVTVGLARHTKADQRAFEKAMAAADEVRECNNVAGAFEYILRVETKDLVTYKRFHTEVLGVVPQVSSITSHIVMGVTKDERG